MLTINKVRLKNFCQHKDATFEFGAGLIGIVGRNGCGKSNLIKGILRALVGETFNPGKKEDDISWTVDQTDDAFIEVTFTTAGHQWVLKRMLKSSTVSLYPADNPKLKTRSAAEVKNKLFPMLNVHPRILTEIVFVLQGSIEGILFQIPSERAKSLQHLFQTHNAERLRELFHDELNNVSLQSREAAIVELETRLKATILGPLDEARRTVAEFTPGMLAPDAVQQMKDIKASWERAKAAAVQISRLRMECAAADEVLKRGEAEIVQLTARLAEQRSMRDGTTALVASAKQIVQAAEVAKNQAAQRAWIEREIASKTALLNMPEPVVTLNEKRVAEEVQALNAVSTELQQLRKMVDEFNTHRSTNCPLCGQPVPQTYLTQRLQRRDELDAYIKDNASAVARNMTQLKSMLDAHKMWSLQLQQATTDSAQLQQQLAQLPAPTPVNDRNLQDAVTLIQAYDQFCQACQRTETELATKTNMTQLNASHAKAWAAQASTAETASASQYSDADYAHATTALSRHEEAALATARAAGVLQTLEAQKVDLETQIARYREEEKKLVNQRRWKEWLEKGKKLLHRDELPALVMRAYLEALNRKLALYLEIFGSQFSAKLLPDTSVRCQFVSDPAKQNVPSERLSGGQKVVLGIAFRFAVYDLFVRDLGLLVLDEPTVYLDKDNIRGVADLLERVKLYSQKSGMQLFVVTHEESLISSFDQTIVLN